MERCCQTAIRCFHALPSLLVLWYLWLHWRYLRSLPLFVLQKGSGEYEVLLSEWLRTKRTAIRWFIFGLPVFLAGCTVVYLILSPGSTQDFAFEGFFTIWSGIMICFGRHPWSAVIREEELAGNFNGFLSFGVSRVKIFLGKFMLVVICTFICTLLAALILGCGMNLFVPCGADMKGVPPCCCIHFDRSGSSSGPSSLDQPCMGMGRFHRA